MPKVKPSEQLPDGFEKISEQLDTYEQQMRDAVANDDGSKKRESNWSIARVNYARTRYVFLMLKRREISEEVMTFCTKHALVDSALLGKWKLPGYEKLCCTQCVNPKNFAHASGCLCRVPMSKRKNKEFTQCAACGCTGCCSADKSSQGPVREKDTAQRTTAADGPTDSSPKSPPPS